jgi:hypothetical protein
MSIHHPWSGVIDSSPTRKLNEISRGGVMRSSFLLGALLAVCCGIKTPQVLSLEPDAVKDANEHQKYGWREVARSDQTHVGSSSRMQNCS